MVRSNTYMSDAIMLCKLLEFTTGETCPIVSNHHFWQPKSRKIALKRTMVAWEVAEFAISAPIHFEWASINIRTSCHWLGQHSPSGFITIDAQASPMDALAQLEKMVCWVGIDCIVSLSPLSQHQVLATRRNCELKPSSCWFQGIPHAASLRSFLSLVEGQ